MKYLSRISFERGRALDDEIDQLFSHLEQFEPPADFVDRVMAEISRLPLPQFMSTSKADSSEYLIEHHQSVASPHG